MGTYLPGFKILQGVSICIVIVSCGAVKSHGRNDALPQHKAGAARDNRTGYHEIGEASWYGPGLHGRKTADGTVYDQGKMTAAHPSLPLGTRAEVTNLENNKTIEVEINDRGPNNKCKTRAIDISSEAAKKLEIKKKGTAKVRIRVKADKNNPPHNSTLKKQAASTDHAPASAP